MNEITVTKHAYEKAKERLSWKKATTERMAEKAFNEGISHKDIKGSLNRYITREYFKYRKGNNIKIYAEHVFIFVGKKLVTVFRIPHKYCSYVNAI